MWFLALLLLFADLEALSRQAWKELEGAGTDTRVAVARRWAETFWSMSQPAAKVESVHFLVHADEYEKVSARSAEFQPADPVWEKLLPVVFEAGERRNDYTEPIRLAGAVAERSSDEAIRSQARELVANANHRLKEMASLGPGSPAPDVSAVVSKAAVRGKPMLFHFWASWCEACKKQIPLLRQLQKDYAAQGLMIAGVSIDEDCGAAENWAVREGMSWTRVCDRGLAKTFAVAGVPATCLIDRNGTIAGRDLPQDRLRAAVAEVTAETSPGRVATEARREARWRIPEVFQALGMQSGARVADIGAGDGFFAVRLSPAVGPRGRVFAVDIDERALATLKARLVRLEYTNVEVIRGDPADPRLAPASLDAALMVRSYHEVEPYREMLAKVRAALKPGGRLVVIDAAPGERGRSRAWQIGKHQLALELAAEDLRAAGFRIVRSVENFLSEERIWLLVGEIPVDSQHEPM